MQLKLECLRCAYWCEGDTQRAFTPTQIKSILVDEDIWSTNMDLIRVGVKACILRSMRTLRITLASIRTSKTFQFEPHQSILFLFTQTFGIEVVLIEKVEMLKLKTARQNGLIWFENLWIWNKSWAKTRTPNSI